MRRHCRKAMRVKAAADNSEEEERQFKGRKIMMATNNQIQDKICFRSIAPCLSSNEIYQTSNYERIIFAQSTSGIFSEKWVSPNLIKKSYLSEFPMNMTQEICFTLLAWRF
jgi:hypothetical protein